MTKHIPDCKMETSANLHLQDIIKQFNLELSRNQQKQIKKLAIHVTKQFVNNKTEPELKIDLSFTEQHICNILTEKLLEDYYDR